MKKGILSILCFFLLLSGFAQDKADDKAPYLKDASIPAFTLLLPDSSWFTREQIPEKYAHTLIIYFSPDCGHCQHEAKEIVRAMDSLKNTFFVFAAYKPLEDISGFASYYGLDKFENVRIGRDPKYFIPSFYRVKFTPFIAAYNKKGQIEKVWDPETAPVPEVTELIAFVNRN